MSKLLNKYLHFNVLFFQERCRVCFPETRFNLFSHSHILVFSFHDGSGLEPVTRLDTRPAAEHHVDRGRVSRKAPVLLRCLQAPGAWTHGHRGPSDRLTPLLKEQDPAVTPVLFNRTFSGPWKQIRHCGDRIPLSERLGREAASRPPPLGLAPCSCSSKARLRGRGSEP